MIATTIMDPKNLFLITYEGAHWCGASDTHVVVHAESADEALYKAENHMEETIRELFSSEYEDERQELSDDDEGCADECAYTVNSVEAFGPEHDHWKWFCDETQRTNFYPEVGGQYFK